MTINWLALLVGALVPMVLGFIWYHPKLFGTAWMNSLGFKEEDLEGGNMPLIFGLSYVLSCVIAWQIQKYAGYHDVAEQTFVHIGYHAGMMGLVIAVPAMITTALFERRKPTNILINAGYWILAFGFMGGVIGLLY